MDLLLLLPAAFFGTVLWHTGGRLLRLLLAAIAIRRISRMGTAGRTAGD